MGLPNKKRISYVPWLNPLINVDKSFDIVNNLNGDKMFDKKELDERGEIPAPFNVEKYNFNPHLSRGDFDFDKNGKPIVLKN